MLSKKTRYAMLALVELAAQYGKGPVPIGVIAGKQMIPQRFLEGILLELKRKGVLASTRGKSGGYYLVVPPRQVSLSEIIVTFEGSMGMLACVCEKKYKPYEFCKDEQKCKIRQTFRYIHDSTSAILRNTSLEDLI